MAKLVNHIFGHFVSQSSIDQWKKIASFWYCLSDLDMWPFWKRKKKNKKVNVGSTKFQLPDDICWDNQGKQAALSEFHHFMWPAWTAQASQGETETDKAL